MRDKSQPPGWINWLIDNLAPHDLAEEIRGDLHEMFLTDIAVRGRRAANRKYTINGMGFLAKRFFWKKENTNSTSHIMIGNYLKMAKRSLVAYRGTSIINILGLVIGIASSLVIFSVVHFEQGFDKFHSGSENIYRIVRVSGEDMSEFRTGISFPVPTALKEEISSLTAITSVMYVGDANVDIVDKSGSTTKKFLEESGLTMVEPNFFSIFDFKGTGFRWIAGNPEKALAEPYSVVLTKSYARKYFGDEDALGQTVQFQKQFDCKVTGIIEDLPENTDFPFTVLISYSSLKPIFGNDRLNDWSSVADVHQAFIVLNPGVTKSEMESQMARVHANHTDKDLNEFRHYLLQELHDVHYDARFGTFNGRTISKETLLALAIIGIFLLLTACINYINLATAQANMRAKEIGLRKVMGSSRKSLIEQFLTETLIVVFIAAILGWGAGHLFLENSMLLLGFDLLHSASFHPFILMLVIAIILVVTVLAGLYPSIIISRFNPVEALKNRFTTERIGGISLRKILVVVQFTVTQILVVGTFIVVSQMKFFRDVDMGFNKEAIITVRIPDSKWWRSGTANSRKVMEDKLRSLAMVENVSFSSTLPSGVNRNLGYRDIGKPDASTLTDYIIFEYEAIDPSYLDLYQIKLLAGRKLVFGDSVGNILVNKTLAKNLGLGLPGEAIGQELKLGGNRRVTVVGVVDDFYSNSLKQGVDNIAMLVEPWAYSTLSIKLSADQDSGSLREAIQQIESVWASTFPEFIFDYQFFDENIKAFYEQEQKYAKLFQMFSIIFLLIGCLGLYGLITFVVNRKGKEVAVRKVLGATFSNIIFMFSGEYVRLILISFLLAVPIAYYAVDSWLSNFANHIPLRWWLFTVPGLLVLVIALLVVTTKSIRTANANPIHKLKYE